MLIQKRFLEFKPCLIENYLIYYRFEHGGYVTIKTIVNSQKTELVNSTYYYILTMCDGVNSVENIIDKIMAKYIGAPKSLIEKDVIKTIEKLSICGGLKLKDNPFFVKESIHLSNELSISYDISACYSSLLKLILQEKGDCLRIFKNPFYDDLFVNSLILNRDFELNKSTIVLMIIDNLRKTNCGFMIWNIQNKNNVILQYYCRNKNIEVFDEKILKNGIALTTKLLKQ
ncbi:PqqD family protein, partial [Enterococcus faecalis]|nr:PqqD family protein [Enterococcus faecalis]